MATGPKRPESPRLYIFISLIKESTQAIKARGPSKTDKNTNHKLLLGPSTLKRESSKPTKVIMAPTRRTKRKEPYLYAMSGILLLVVLFMLHIVARTKKTLSFEKVFFVFTSDIVSMTNNGRL